MTKNKGPTKLTDKQEKKGKGHPRAFLTDKDLYNKAKSYILKCDTQEQLANIAGFCVFCDITRETFYKQEDYYSDTYKKVNDMLENAALNHKATAMGIFYLKNKFQYRDKQEVESNNTNHNYNYEAELQELIK